MKSTANIMVLLVEDNIEGIECDHAFDGETGFQRALTGEYDVILLDIMLPFRDGISICNALRNEGIDTPVLMLTARDTLADKLEGFGAGADDYLVKPFALEELLMRTRVLSRRRSGEIRRFSLGDLIVDFENRHVARSGQAISLSPTSWTILEVLAQNSPHVVTRSRLSMALWQGDPPDTNALKTHLYKLRMRIDKPFDQNLIHTVAGQGVALRE